MLQAKTEAKKVLNLLTDILVEILNTTYQLWLFGTSYKSQRKVNSASVYLKRYGKFAYRQSVEIALEIIWICEELIIEVPASFMSIKNLPGLS